MFHDCIPSRYSQLNKQMTQVAIKLVSLYQKTSSELKAKRKHSTYNYVLVCLVIQLFSLIFC